MNISRCQMQSFDFSQVALKNCLKNLAANRVKSKHIDFYC